MKKLKIKTPRLEVEAHDVPPWLAFAALIAVVSVVGALILTGLWAP